MHPPPQPMPNDAALPRRADVAVIGGGTAGVAMAYSLAEKGRSVALLEKGSIAGEQSSRNWGWCRTQNRDARELPLQLLSMQLWDALSRGTGEGLGFRRTGLICVTESEKELATWSAWIDMARQYQVRHIVLTPAAAKRLTPGNEQDWIGGVHAPTDGRAEPSMAAPALARAARAGGATM